MQETVQNECEPWSGPGDNPSNSYMMYERKQKPRELQSQMCPHLAPTQQQLFVIPADRENAKSQNIFPVFEVFSLR